MFNFFKYIWWKITDNGKNTYWGKLDEVRIWKKNPIKIKFTEFDKEYGLKKGTFKKWWNAPVEESNKT